MRLSGMVARPTEKPMKARMTSRSGSQPRPGLARLGSERWRARPAMEADTDTQDTTSSTRRPARSISAMDTDIYTHLCSYRVVFVFLGNMMHLQNVAAKATAPTMTVQRLWSRLVRSVLNTCTVLKMITGTPHHCWTSCSTRHSATGLRVAADRSEVTAPRSLGPTSPPVSSAAAAAATMSSTSFLGYHGYWGS